ncbi:FAD-dependent monooxygenase [Ampullimonas aquatilis]|uniref:FAD-dependent oxidoreductase n=1 Tax=Ampullimonas aquatilis TaxID=1341549 RepID=UPI003C7331F3
MSISIKPKIAIVGGGPAGLTAAVILHRGGHRVCVYEGELSTAHRAQGGTLDLHEDKGQIALKRAGLLDAFRAIARHEDQDERDVDSISGRAIAGTSRPDEHLDRPEIDRGVLRNLLLDALPADVVRWGSRLTHIDSGGACQHELFFADGSRVKADLVIGADGAWSRVRPSLSEIQPIYTGITFFEGWIEAPTTQEAALVGRGSLFSFGGAEAIFAQRNGQGRICIYAALKRPKDRLENETAHIAARELLQTCYQNWAPNLRHLLHACGVFAERLIYTLPADFGWMPRMGITLIGDAAHLMPPVGLGVNLAMLDAADIATALCGEPDWRNAIRLAEVQINDRARAVMPDAIEGFQQWFSSRS